MPLRGLSDEAMIAITVTAPFSQSGGGSAARWLRGYPIL